jgi:hypothetical protein
MDAVGIGLPGGSRPEVQCSERGESTPESAATGGTASNLGSTAVGMSVVVVLDDRKRLNQLRDKLAASQPPMAQLVAIGQGETELSAVDRLDPAAARRRRQRGMARWLMPFGFLAGLTFTFITDLHTFDFVGPWGQPVIGGLLGMGSGWMGSYAAAASVSSEEDDRVRSLRNRLEEGNWLLLVETGPGGEIPWNVLQQARPKAVVRLGET